MGKIINKISKLIDLKSILTLLLAITLVIIIFRNIVITDEGIRTLFITITTSVFTHYFTKKSSNNDKEE